MNFTRPLLVLLTLSCAVACAAERNFDERIDAAPGGHLTIDLDLGSVSMTGTDAHEVIVHAKATGSEHELSRIEVFLRPGVELREHYDRASVSSWLGSSSPRVHFTIEVPRDYPVEIKTNGGSLELASLHAGAHGATNGGSITVRDVAGAVNLHTMGGHISAEHLAGPTELVTMGGHIDARDVRGDLEARTMGGSITLVGVDGRVSAHTSGGSVTTEELGDHDVTLETNGGSIGLKLPATAHASIDASTFGGSVRTSLPMTIETSGNSHLKGSLNGAGHLIRLHTFGGSITIDPRA